MIVINDKEIILGYINLVGEEILRDKKTAIDLDEKIDIESRNIPYRDIDKALKIRGKRIKIAKKIIKNHDNIHKMIDYAAEEGYEIKWDGYKAIDLFKNLCDTNPFNDDRFGG